MAKGKGKGTQAAQANTGAQGTQAAQGPVIALVPGAKVAFRQGTARAAYYAVFAAHAGQPLSACLQAIAAAPPSVPAKGKLAGQAEPVQGWVRWFVRHGYITLQQQA